MLWHSARVILSGAPPDPFGFAQGDGGAQSNREAAIRRIGISVRLYSNANPKHEVFINGTQQR